MTYANLLHTVPEGLRQQYRRHESLCKKLVNLEWSTKFNSICLQEEILPNFSTLRLHDPAVALTAKTMKYRRYLVERELDSKEKQRIDIELQKNMSSKDIESFACDDVLKIPISEALRGILDNYRNVVKTRTIKKNQHIVLW